MFFSKNKQFLSNIRNKSKIGACKFHTSCVMGKKISDRQKKVLMNDPGFQGQQKMQAMQEKALKEGIPITPPRRVALLSGQTVLDYTLPFPRKFNPNKNKKLAMSDMKKQCLDLYLKFNVDRAKNDFTSMENYVSPTYLRKIQSEHASKKPKPNILLKWQCDPSIKAKRLSLRMIETAPMSTEVFLQVVYKITSTQKTAPMSTEVFLQVVYKITITQKVTAYNKTTGEEVGGTPFEAVTDYIGFEKELTNYSTSPWMVLEQLFEAEEELTEPLFKQLISQSMGNQTPLKE